MSKQLDENSKELNTVLLALTHMYDQYCGDNYGHNFMSAGENAIEILEDYGLADEAAGVNESAEAELERLVHEHI